MKILITYKVIVPGFFLAKEHTVGEIVEMKGRSISKTVEEDLEKWKWKLQMKNPRVVVSVADFKIID